MTVILTILHIIVSIILILVVLLQTGKRADLVLLNTSRIGFAMQGSLADRVVNFASREDVDSVWIGGEARKRHGEMIGVSWATLKSQIEAAQARFGPEAASITFT